MIRKIISGGQTGADRGGLDAAVDLGLARGGWAPKFWRSEDGVIPERYRAGMRESSGGYYVRTIQNVRSSDGTLILSFEDALPQNSGSRLTLGAAIRWMRPYRHMVLPRDGRIADFALRRAMAWLVDNQIVVLNVAGPRESREPGIQQATRQALVEILRPQILETKT